MHINQLNKNKRKKKMVFSFIACVKVLEFEINYDCSNSNYRSLSYLIIPMIFPTESHRNCTQHKLIINH